MQDHGSFPEDAPELRADMVFSLDPSETPEAAEGSMWSNDGTAYSDWLFGEE